MTNEDFYFDTELNYKIVKLSSGEHSNHFDQTIIVPFPLLILCTNGNAIVEYNLEKYTISKDSLFCIFPNTTLKPLEVSEDFEGTALAFVKDAIIDSTIGFKIEYLGNIFVTPIKNFENEQEKTIIKNLFDTLYAYSLLDKRFERNTDFVYGIIRNIIITLAEITQKASSQKLVNATSFTTTDNYFRDFMNLLSQHSKTQHNVAFYADNLCITPKYLNEICRKKTKKTAKEVITRAVIAQIKNALIVSGTSVQRIAYDFNFCDQSSFGKYFKKAVGIAPMAFRNQHVENENIINETEE